VAELAKAKLEERYPGLLICGTDCPPLGFEKNPEQESRILQKIQAATPDIIFVALGAPKQELWMYRSAPLLKSGVLLGIGAALEFCAGTVRRAPVWMQNTGAEWIFRLCQEPRRLARRYLRDTEILLIIFRVAKAIGWADLQHAGRRPFKVAGGFKAAGGKGVKKLV
jgi:N-acetylglucosaminyldiphosphoundecaprenol N-acetyl-beta-D-mannosaminyltransferase